VKTLALLAGLGATFVLAVVFWPSTRSGPEPIAYGSDACAHCRMHITRPGFGGEIRDRDGTLTKYDDVGCLLQAMLAKRHEIPESWVEDHDSGRLVPLLTAHLVRTERSATPMGSGIVAFQDDAAARAFARSAGADLVRLEDLVREPARLAHEDAR